MRAKKRTIRNFRRGERWSDAFWIFMWAYAVIFMLYAPVGQVLTGAFSSCHGGSNGGLCAGDIRDKAASNRKRCPTGSKLRHFRAGSSQRTDDFTQLERG